MSNKAFTLVELLVTIAIIGILTVTALVNYRFSNRQLALQRSTQKLSQDLRRAEELAISAKEFGGVIPYGYGVYFDLDDAGHYIMFADSNNDQLYSGTNERVESVALETSIVLTALDPVTLGSSLTILFMPPDPTVIFDPDATLATISLNAAGTPPLSPQNIRVNKAGLIAVE
jgi:prepilin-type N-terminal cleavage/methylation domain-containing protein